MKKTAILIICTLHLSIFNFCLLQTAQAQYKIVDKIHIDGDGGWDYLTIDESYTGSRIVCFSWHDSSGA